MVVYLDLLFLVNFIVDGALLLVTALLVKSAIKGWRLAASAGIGALYVVFVLFPELSFLYTLGIKFVYSLLMILTAFGFGSLQRFLRHLGGFYLVNFAAAGGVFAVYYFFMSSSDVLNGILFARSGGLPFSLPTGILVIVLPACIWLFYRFFNSVRKSKALASHLADVRVEIDGFVYACRGLVDTGNRLYDPLTRTPVMVVEVTDWTDVLPEAWLKRIRSAEPDRILASVADDDFLWRDRLRLVPYRGVNRGTQFMLALKPDRVFVRYNDREWETERVLVGMDGGRLSPDGAYRAIIHPELIAAALEA